MPDLLLPPAERRPVRAAVGVVHPRCGRAAAEQERGTPTEQPRAAGDLAVRSAAILLFGNL